MEKNTSIHMVKKIIIDAKAQDLTAFPIENDKFVACMGQEVRYTIQIFIIKNDEPTGPATRQ